MCKRFLQRESGRAAAIAMFKKWVTTSLHYPSVCIVSFNTSFSPGFVMAHLVPIVHLHPAYQAIQRALTKSSILLIIYYSAQIYVI